MNLRGGRELYMMPLNTDQWRKITSLLTLEEHGALLQACLEAWAAPLRGHPTVTLPNNDRSIDLIIGKRSLRLRAMIRQHFEPSAEHPGFLSCPWLAEWYHQALARYMARAIAGRKGGISRGTREHRNRTFGTQPLSAASSTALAPLQAGLEQPKPNGVLTPHTDRPMTSRPDDHEQTATGTNCPFCHAEPRQDAPGLRLVMHHEPHCPFVSVTRLP